MKALSLITASAPFERDVKRTLERLISPAQYEMRDTGKSEIKNIDNGNGVIEQTKTPIMERVLIPAEVKVEEITVKVWIVETEHNGEKEEHEFANEEAALNYFKEF